MRCAQVTATRAAAAATLVVPLAELVLGVPLPGAPRGDAVDARSAAPPAVQARALSALLRAPRSVAGTQPLALQLA